MSADDERKVLLYASDGRTLAREVVILCVGTLPRLIEWDDSPDGTRHFLHEAGVSYREQPAYLLSLGAVTTPQVSKSSGAKTP